MSNMTAISKDDFLACLKASHVISPKQLVDALADISSDEPKQIAVELVRKKLLTRWQAKYLIAGHSLLHVGNYLLLERLRRNEFGDRFLAVHEQLDRLVEIQILPKSLNDQCELRDKFLSSASIAAQVDHPNLVHVYDIDQERKRLYLVVEHTTGKPLSSFDPADLSAMDIARLVEQSLLGLQAAHEQGIVHGLIDENNVIVTDEEQIKIQNLVMSSLENPDHSTATPAGDIRAVGAMGHELLKCLDSKNAGQSELAAVIENVQSADSVDLPHILSLLELWIEQNGKSSTQTVNSGLAIETASIAEAAPEKTTAPLDSNNDLDRTARQSFLQRQNPAAVIGVAASICLLTLGSVAWLAYSTTRARPVANMTTVVKPPTTSTPVEFKQDRPELKATGQPHRSGKQLKQHGKDVPDQKLTMQEIQAELDKIGSDKTVLATTQVSAEPDAKSPPRQSGGSPTESAPPIKANPSVSEPDSGNPDEQPTLSELDESAMPDETDVANSSTGAAGKAAADDDKASKNTSADFENPFEAFPRFTDLGNIADVSPREIGSVHVPPNILMAVEIISGDAISRSKCNFELARSPDAKQRWFASFIKRKGAPAVKVGEFFKQDDTFFFQWDPGAAESDDHNYLRNCVLKLTGNNEKATFLNLRAPVEIEGLAITQENGMARVDADIQWLPDPDNLKIEVIPMPYQGVPKSYMFPPDRQVGKRQPVFVFFTDEAKDRFFYVQVTADLKKTLKLNSALMFNALDGSNPVVADQKIIESVTNHITHVATVTNADYEQVKVAERPDEIKYDDFEELKKGYKKAAETAQAQKVRLLEYANMFPALYGKAIPLRVYFVMDGMQIELARSSPTE